MTDQHDTFNGEKVLVISDEIIGKYLTDGSDFFPSDVSSIPELITRNAFFMERAKAENDETYRQLIPYVICRRTKENSNLYFLFKRLSTQGEKRLHNLYSLGAGGHINPIDDISSDPITSGLKRELEEELFLPKKYSLSFQGWIYSRIDPVSRVHVGMVHFLDVLDGEIEIRERDKMLGEWSETEKLRAIYDSMEGWTKIVMDNLIMKIT